MRSELQSAVAEALNLADDRRPERRRTALALLDSLHFKLMRDAVEASQVKGGTGTD